MIMDYEKLHKDTIAKLQEMVNSGKITAETARGICADFVPESEDERIRKALIVYLRSILSNKKYGDKFIEDWIAWLEKQADHAKFINSIQVGDKVTRNQDGVLVNLSQLKRVAKPAEVQGEQKPVEPQQDMLSQEKYAKAVDECIYGERKPAWSEEDEKLLDNTIRFIENCVAATSPSLRTYNPILTGKEIPFLKSLKDRYTWKPSDEQINCLSGEIAYKERWESSYSLNILKELLDDLKKLKG